MKRKRRAVRPWSAEASERHWQKSFLQMKRKRRAVRPWSAEASERHWQRMEGDARVEKKRERERERERESKCSLVCNVRRAIKTAAAEGSSTTTTSTNGGRRIRNMAPTPTPLAPLAHWPDAITRLDRPLIASSTADPIKSTPIQSAPRRDTQ